MKKLLTIALFTLSSSLFTVCEAQYDTISNFQGVAGGANPICHLVRIGKKFFGTAQYGGASNLGTVFSVDTSGKDYKDLYDFSGAANGSVPSGALVISVTGDSLFGVCNQGGASGDGVVFSIDTDGTHYNMMHNFAGGAGGQYPDEGLVLSGKTLFGVTYSGGTGGGVLYSIHTNGSNFKNILNFGGIAGSTPEGSLITSGTQLFGTTSGGNGVIFSIDTDGTHLKSLHAFNGTNGSAPWGALTLAKTTLYGTATTGGANSDGCVFSIDTTGAGFADIFDFGGANGKTPNGYLVLSGTTLYGMTNLGGAHNLGVLFSINTTGTGYTDLHDFANGTGGIPQDGVTLIGNVVFGVTYSYGTTGNGVIFRFKQVGLGTDEISSTTSSVNVYPNPSNGAFTLRVESEKLKVESASVEVYSMLGEKVYSQFSTLNSQLSINLSNQPSGIYLYRVIGNSGELIGEGKIILQK